MAWRYGAKWFFFPLGIESGGAKAQFGPCSGSRVSICDTVSNFMACALGHAVLQVKRTSEAVRRATAKHSAAAPVIAWVFARISIIRTSIMWPACVLSRAGAAGMPEQRKGRSGKAFNFARSNSMTLSSAKYPWICSPGLCSLWEFTRRPGSLTLKFASKPSG